MSEAERKRKERKRKEGRKEKADSKSLTWGQTQHRSNIALCDLMATKDPDTDLAMFIGETEFSRNS